MRKMRPEPSWLRGLSLAVFLSAAGATGAAAEDTIILGAAVSTTGKYAQNGANTRNGYDLAVDAINAKGGVTVGGKRYELVIKYYDDESTPARCTELAERLIRQDGVKFVLGPYSSGLTKAMLPIIEKYRVPMVEGNGAARELFTRGYRYLFAVLSTSDQYLSGVIELAAENAEKLGKPPAAITVAFAMEDDPFAQDVRAGVLDDIKRHGMKVVIDDQLPPELNDMSATLAKVKALKPDLLVVSGHEKGAMTAVTQIKALHVYVPMLALTHCNSAQIAEKLGEASEHAFCAGQWHQSLNYRDEIMGAAADFAKRFKGRYGYEASDQAAQSAASVLVFADAFARAQSLEPEKVRDAIAATDLQTFFGRIKFDDTGKNVAKPMVLTQVRGGRYLVVSPKEWATDKPVIPRPKP
jgi:branched-chain amino acid transport system substrate-binding protein